MDRAVATGTVGPVSTGPLFEATTTFLPIFMNSAVRPADRLAAMWPQLTELEINSLKATLPSLQSAKVSWEPILITEKWRWQIFLCYAPLCHCLRQPHPLLQSYHFKFHGYGPDGTCVKMVLLWERLLFSQFYANFSLTNAQKQQSVKCNLLSTELVS